MKKILFLLLITIASYGQTYQNPTFGTIKAKTSPTVTTSSFITTTGADGTQGKILGENISLSVIPPVTHFTPVTPNIKGYFQGVDDALGDIVSTTAGVTTRLWLTADQVTIFAVDFFKTNFVNKGVVASAVQSVTNNDNEKKFFAKDIIGDAYSTITTFPKGVYAGNLSVSTTPNSAQQRFTVEVYKCNTNGTPIASGVSGAVTGSLGVTVITILDSGLLDLADASVTNVQVSNTIDFPFTINVGERVRYHISAEKVGTTGANITESLYLGTSYNSYIDVPVPLNTTAVQNLSTVSGSTATDALNNLDASVIHKTTNETKNGTLGVNGIIYNTNASAPSALDGAQYKLTQPTTAGQSWSTTYTPILTKYNGLTDYVRDKPASFRKKLMVIGSSVAFGQGATSNNGWANKLGVDLVARGWTFKNHAIPGNSTQMVIDRFYTDVVPENPDVLIIALSLINEDILNGCCREVNYNLFKSNLQKLVLMCKQQGIIPVITSTYANNFYTSIEYNYIQQINKDLDSWGVAGINMLGALDDLTGKFVAGSFADGSHPNDVGHQEMYKSVPISMFDCLMSWDYKRMKPEMGAITIGTDTTTDRPIESIFDTSLSNYTVAFWLKVNDPTSTGNVLAGFGTGAARFSNSGGIGLRYVGSTGASVDFGVFPEATRQWYHVAVTYNSITLKSRVYLNGVFTGEIGDNVSLSKFVLGGRADAGQASLNAKATDFKDLVIYRTRLTDLQLKELYSGNVLKSGLEIFASLSDKDINVGYRLLNFAPTISYIKINSAQITDKSRGVLNTDIVANKIVTLNLITNNSTTGIGNYVSNSSSGYGNYGDNTGTGVLNRYDSSTGSTGDLMNFSKNNVLTTKFDHNGIITTPNIVLTGTPTAPTATAGTNTTQIATTAFVQANSVKGSGTGKFLPKFAGSGASTTLDNSGIYDNSVGISFGGSTVFGGYEFLIPTFGNNTIYLGVKDGVKNPRSYISQQTTSTTQEVRFGSAFSSGSTFSNWIFESGKVLINTTTDNGVDQVQANGSVLSTQYKISALNTAPASATATGTLGEIRVTATYIYVCTATNTWVRSALTTW